ncbi:Ferredoxin--NADP(+) reductase [Caenispirillum salinarum AK4]|uniref:Ferredoxin--NADP(+) reductase n=1 Tax=Caenispirillum salinarum AK4 TaxID=1238182 RepID=K9GT87_9PROT|nr:FAD-dependent oxidoreductase [Caenispirillum salinarum]EKV28402.1 Ferredoxin--NADP(+) reductase [Caenispirillum salinarum AK4]
MSVTGSVCIIGSGPAGLYCAEEIKRLAPEVAVDVLDRLPTPYGLVRGGVAPDHQKTKQVIRQFEPLFSKGGVRFLGNVSVGHDIDISELRRLYDVVVIAVGAAGDRKLGVKGEDLAGVYGSAAFVGWYNGHPDFADLAPRIPGPGVAVIGNGNVALDVARILALTPEEAHDTDLARPAASVIERHPVTDIYVLGRRGPAQAAFTAAELREMGELAQADPIVEPHLLPEHPPEDMEPRAARVAKRNLEILHGFAQRARRDVPVRVHMLFHRAPRAILGNGQGNVAGLLVEHTKLVKGQVLSTGVTESLKVGTVVTCIGYKAVPFPGVPLDERRGVIANTDGVVEPGLYVVGWARHGPRGVITANRASAREAAGHALEHLSGKTTHGSGGAGLEKILSARGYRHVCYDDWCRIDAAERARAHDGAPREKFIHVSDMLALLEENRRHLEAVGVKVTD